MISKVNSDEFLRLMTAHVNRAMQEAAEPIIKSAIEEAETAMREQLASTILAMHEHYQITMDKHTLTIQVQIGKKP